MENKVDNTNNLNSSFDKICKTKSLLYFLTAAICGAAFGIWGALIGITASILSIRLLIITWKRIVILSKNFYAYLMSRD